MLNPGFGLIFGDLYANSGLARVDGAFLAHLATVDATLSERLSAARADPAALGRLGESELLLALAPHLEDFIARLFRVEVEVTALQAAQHELAPLFACKRQVVQRKALNRYKRDIAIAFDGDALRTQLEPKIGAPLAGIPGELAFALAVGSWGQDETANEADIDLALRYAAWAVHSAEGKARHKAGVLFKTPRKLDFMRLVPSKSRPQRCRDVFCRPAICAARSLR